MSGVPVHFVPSFHIGSGASAGAEGPPSSVDVEPPPVEGPAADDDDGESEGDGSGGVADEGDGDDDDGADEHAATSAAISAADARWATEERTPSRWRAHAARANREFRFRHSGNLWLVRADQLFETQLPPDGMPPPPLLVPASIGRPPVDPPPPAPPKRSRQQCVAGLQVESHGAPAWISDILENIFWKSPAQLHAGTDEPPELDELPPLDEVVEPELEVEPPELDVLPPLDEVVEPPDGLLGGRVCELSVLVPPFACWPLSSPGMSEADSAHARTSADARNAEAATTCTDCSFMAREYLRRTPVKQAWRLHRKTL